MEGSAILIMTFTAFKSPVILAGMPVSSHRDVKPQGDGNAKSSTYALSKLPSMALDFGIPAKMTAHIAIMRIAVEGWPLSIVKIRIITIYQYFSKLQAWHSEH
jgi:hypothetical protein